MFDKKGEDNNDKFTKAIEQIVTRYGGEGITAEIYQDFKKIYDQHQYLTENAYYMGLFFLVEAIWEDEPWEDWGELFRLIVEYKTFLKDTKDGKIIS